MRSPGAFSIDKAMASCCLQRRRARSSAATTCVFRLSGAGGQRDAAAISTEFAEEYVSKEAAMRDYEWSEGG